MENILTDEQKTIELKKQILDGKWGHCLSLDEILNDIGFLKNEVETFNMEEFIFKQSFLVRKNGKTFVNRNVDPLASLMACCPPGTILEDILLVFKDKTDFPLELPFFMFLTYLGLYLNIKGKAGIKRLHNDLGKIEKLTFCLLIISESGDGKSQTQEFMKQLFEKILKEENIELPIVGQCQSERAYMENIQAIGEIGLLNIDEFGQYLLKASRGSDEQAAAILRFFLMLYDGKVEYKTKDTNITLSNLNWSVLTATTPTSMDKKFSDETLNNGFGNRQMVVYGTPRDTINANPKHWGSFNSIFGKVKTLIDSVELQEVYSISQEAEDAFETSFNLMSTVSVPKGFIKRTLNTSYKFALLMKILRGRGHIPYIEAEDMGYAGRIAGLLLANVVKLFDSVQGQEFTSKIVKLEEWLLDKSIAWPFITLRQIIQYKKASTTKEAKDMLDIIGYGLDNKNIVYKKFK